MHSSLKVGTVLTLTGLGLCALAAAPARAQTVTNPGFETGDFTGYTVVDPSGFTFVDDGSPGGSLISPHSGTFFAALGPSGTTGTLSQDIATTVGDKYKLSFFLTSDGFPATASGDVNEFAVDFAGTNLTLDDYTATNYTKFSLTGIATSTITPLTFSSRNDAGFFGLDDISITDLSNPVPEASTMASFGLLLVLGMGGMVVAAKRKKAQAQA